MVRPRSGEGRFWRWALVFVAAIHLLTTAGAWWITDHGEILAVADRFLTTGRLDLRDLGPGWEDWSRIVAHRPSAETRFLPLSILPLVPFLALDRLLSGGDPGAWHAVHLEGHVFVLAGLWMAGRFIARTRGDAAAALAVFLLGLNWPVWMIARRLGPEPILFALLAAFAASGKRTRFWCLVLLPWVHASGPLLGLGAWAWASRLEPAPRARAAGRAALGWVCGVLSVALLWNLPVHGSPFMGGYARYTSDAFFALSNPLVGTLSFLGAMGIWTLPLWYLAVRAGRETLMETVALWAPPVLFFGLFSQPEPLRRLAPLLGAWVIAVFVRMPAITGRRIHALCALTLASGVIGLTRDFVDVVPTPLGPFSGPRLLWLHLAFVEHRPGLSGALVAGLLALAVVSGFRTLSVVSVEDPPTTAPGRP